MTEDHVTELLLFENDLKVSNNNRVESVDVISKSGLSHLFGGLSLIQILILIGNLSV